jgi:prepilin-type N-terminal cleavage/methylation domain-containing protein
LSESVPQHETCPRPRTRDHGVGRARRAYQAGFTLMEVLVGCALLTIVFAAALPSIASMRSSFDVQNTTFQIANDLRLARERAITINGKGRVTFSSSNYQMKRESPVGSGTYVNDGASMTFPTGVTASSNPANPTFDSRGIPVATYTITVNKTGATAKTITVTAIGRINVN